MYHKATAVGGIEDRPLWLPPPSFCPLSFTTHVEEIFSKYVRLSSLVTQLQRLLSIFANLLRRAYYL